VSSTVRQAAPIFSGREAGNLAKDCPKIILIAEPNFLTNVLH
jgi:hypothetical protein